jgi:hypothetical protein
VFCPNCGTKNDDTATPCKKCGFKLSGAAAPKFRGTMMLNTEQSVQEMVEEHRRKLAEAGPSPDPAPGPVGPEAVSMGSAPATGGPQSKSVLQPPRAGLPKRRMGTMLGVAPQMGGVQPPVASESTPPPPPDPGADPSIAGAAPDPLGGTVAFAAVPSAERGAATRAAGESPPPPPAASPRATHPLAAGRTEAFAAVPPAAAPSPVISPLPAGRTEAFQQVPASTRSPLAAGRTEAFAVMPEAAPAAPARARTEALQASSPAAAPPHAPSEPPDSYHPAGVPRLRLRPLDVFLIVVTCGLYGLVLWAQQRRKPG